MDNTRDQSERDRSRIYRNPDGAIRESGSIPLEAMLNRTPMRCLATPEEIASAAAFLGGAESSFIEGQVLYFDGGFMADYGVPPKSD